MKGTLIRKTILLRADELQFGSNRQHSAENLILQLPVENNGRNTWLLNFGRGWQANGMREVRDLKFMPDVQAAETRNQQLERLNGRQKNCWYWISGDEDSKIWSPVFVDNENNYVMAGHMEVKKDLDKMVWKKATLPDNGE